MSVARKGGVIEKAIGVDPRMVTATRMDMTMHGKTITSMATPTGTKNGKAMITVMAIVMTNPAGM